MKKLFIKILFIAFLGYIALFLYREYKIKSRSHFISSISVCNNSKVEKYKVFSWDDFYADFLTDSVSFREFMGTYNYYEDILYESRGDSIIVNKFNMEEDQPKLIERKIYSLATLKKKRNYK